MCPRPLRCHGGVHWSTKSPTRISGPARAGQASPTSPSPRPHRNRTPPLSRSPSHNPPNGTKPIKDRPPRQGLVHCTVCSLSRHPAPLLPSRCFGRETEQTFISHQKIKIFCANLFNNRRASAPGLPPAACYLEIGVEACALAGRKSLLCYSFFLARKRCTFHGGTGLPDQWETLESIPKRRGSRETCFRGLKKAGNRGSFYGTNLN